MTQVQIKSIEQLEEIAQQLDGLTQTFKEETDRTNYIFSVKTQGQHSDTIQALEDYLQSMGILVMERLPNHMRKLSQSLTSYSQELGTSGFASGQLQSQDEAVEKVSTWLREDKKKEVQDLGKRMQDQVQTIQEAIAQAPYPASLESVPISTHIKTLVDQLDSYADQREKTHQQVSEHKDRFVQSIKSLKAKLPELKYRLQEYAKLDINLAFTMVDEIVAGRLTADTMPLIYACHSKDDREVLIVLLREKEWGKVDFYTSLAKVETKGISSSMMRIIYHKLYRLFSSASESEEDRKVLNYFAQIVCIKNNRGDAKTYFQRLEAAGAVEAQLEGQGFARRIGRLPSGYDQKAYEQYKERNKSLFEEAKELQREFDQRGCFAGYLYAQALSIEKQHSLFFLDQIDDEVQLLSGMVKDKKVEIKFTTSGSDIKNAENISDYIDIDREIEKKQKDFCLDLFQDGLSIYSPQAGALVGIGRTVVDGDESNPEGAANLGQSLADYYDQDSKVAPSFELAKNAFSNLAKIESLEEEKRKQMKKIIGDYLDGDGVLVSGLDEGGKQVVHRTNTYDLSLHLQRSDLELNGLRSYVYNVSGGDVSKLNSFDQLSLSRTRYPLDSFESYNDLKGDLGKLIDDIEWIDLFTSYSDNAKVIYPNKFKVAGG